MKIPELDYLDWCKDIMNAKSIKETYRRDWIRLFCVETDTKINGIQFAIMMGWYKGKPKKE